MSEGSINGGPTSSNVSMDTPAVLSYTQGTGHPRGGEVLLRTLLIFAGFFFGAAGMLLVGLTLWWLGAVFWGFEMLKIPGVVAVVVAIACALFSLEQRRARHWFVMGLLIGAGLLCLVFGLMFLAM
jgi:hypothetical protein